MAYICICLFVFSILSKSGPVLRDLFDLFHDNMPVENPLLRKGGTFQKSNSQLPGDPLPVSVTAPPHVRMKAENSWEERLWNRGLTWDEGHSLTLLSVVPINQVIERVTERMCQLNHRTLLWLSSSYWACTHAHTHTHTSLQPSPRPAQPFSEAVNNKPLQPHGISHASNTLFICHWLGASVSI